VLCCLAAAFMMGQFYLFRKRIAGWLGFGVSASRAVDWHPGQSQPAVTSGAQRRRRIAWTVPAVAMLLSTVLIAVHLHHHQQQPVVDGGTSMCRSSWTEAAAK